MADPGAARGSSPLCLLAHRRKGEEGRKEGEEEGRVREKRGKGDEGRR